ncbi:hypothetical protein LCGC14_0707460 [marine sediment metagenome]|uniref:Csa3 N-terminal domain-containing protein n=1 Tax=marine sediment metagenome TaxID=412755 RepID=A0A0F9QG26_9ZZZZ
MSINDLMRIQIASFALVPEHIYIAERNFHAEKLIIILSNENQNKDVELKIKEITEFYKKLNVNIEKIYVNYKNFMEMTLILANILNKFTHCDEILLNLSGGRRSIPISLIYAGTFISNFKEIKINCVVIPEDKTYSPFKLLPSYLPDKIDIKILSTLKQGITLINMQKSLGIKQPTISMRLKRLERHGFIDIKGRKRELTDLGRMVAGINNLKFNREE